MQQPRLFPDMHPRVSLAGREDHGILPAPAPAPALDDHPSLFHPPAVLRAELDAAIGDGRFEEAKRCYVALAGEWGASEVRRGTAFVAALDPAVFDRPAGELLDAWRRLIDPSHHDRDAHRRAWRGLIVRCRGAYAPRALVAARPECLAPIANALFTTDAATRGGVVEGRELVRDALAAGQSLRAEDFVDRAVRDLLSENLGPEWLASLGAIRRTWTVTPVNEAEATALLRDQAGMDARHLGRRFWECLCVSRNPRVTDAVRQEARRRMKQLHPELHAMALRGER